MNTVRRNSRWVCIIILFFSFLQGSAPVFAAPDLYYEAEKRIVQFMRWEAQKDVYTYELLIEKLEHNRWEPVLRETTESTEVKTALTPGEYRYRVDVTDLLGRRRPSAEWSRLTVLPAFQPELTSFTPVVHTIEDGDLTVNFNGKALEPDARFELVSADGERIVAAEIQINPEKTGGTALFPQNALKTGYWSLLARNPGGLETALSTLVINREKKSAAQTAAQAAAPQAATQAAKPQMPALFLLQESYAVQFPVHGVFTGFFDAPWYPAGAVARFAFLPLRGKTWTAGPEIEPVWSYMESSGVYERKNYVITAHYFAACLNMFFQKRFLDGHLGLNARAGGGMSVLYDVRVRQQDDRGQWIVSGEEFSGMVPLADFTVSASFIWGGRYFLDAGVEGRVLFTKDTPAYIVPLLSFGIFF